MTADDLRRPPPEGDEQSGKATFAQERPQADDIHRPPPKGDEQSGKATFAHDRSAFEQMGGEPAVRALVDRFYDLMDLEAGHATIRQLHPGSLDGSRNKLYWFLCGWMGGPQHYVERFGHPRLRARHLPYSIGIRERDQWLACMRQAMTDVHVDPSLADRLYESFTNTADWMRNRGV